VAVLVQSGIMSPKLAHYFFGYYVIAIVKNDQFMRKLGAVGADNQLKYWLLLTQFAKTMEGERDKWEKAHKKIISSLRV